ncbi:capsid protein [Weissella muntiaci]|uniref:Capsid protein n=1 Tax=Weissella muntiaci TaxID=2508881 RepID=A0A6C2C6B9_9LACO|nr:minor capsid protein [Weissella muntiaci]TYC48815.1 capsid protein [Weissella muntiaci]
MNNDFISRLADVINDIEGLPFTAIKGFLDANEGISVYPLPGGQVISEDMSGARDVELPFEIAIKTQKQEIANDTLWRINDVLSSFDLKVESANSSYEFNDLNVDKPFLQDVDDKGFFIYLLDVKASIRI